MPLKLKGILPAVVTPFKNNMELDEDSLRTHIRFLIENGVSGLVVNGSTGEASSMLPSERKRVIEIAVEETKDGIPVVPGTGATSTIHAIELTKDAKDAGADAVMVVTPYYLIPDEKGIIKHYEAIAAAVDIPIVLYNIPAHTNVDISPELTDKLCESISNIVGLKDSTGNLGQFSKIISLVGDKISLLTGSDDILFSALTLGAKGAILALGNIAPKMTSELYENVKQGNYEQARDISTKLLPIAECISVASNFPAQVKEALKLLGRSVGPTRSPIFAVPEDESKKIKDALEYAELL